MVIIVVSSTLFEFFELNVSISLLYMFASVVDLCLWSFYYGFIVMIKFFSGFDIVGDWEGRNMRSVCWRYVTSCGCRCIFFCMMLQAIFYGEKVVVMKV